MSVQRFIFGAAAKFAPPVKDAVARKSASPRKQRHWVLSVVGKYSILRSDGLNCKSVELGGRVGVSLVSWNGKVAPWVKSQRLGWVLNASSSWSRAQDKK